MKYAHRHFLTNSPWDEQSGDEQSGDGQSPNHADSCCRSRDLSLNKPKSGYVSTKEVKLRLHIAWWNLTAISAK